MSGSIGLIGIVVCKPISWLPDIPFYEASVILILGVGIVYYAVTQLNRTDVPAADTATGEAVIG